MEREEVVALLPILFFASILFSPNGTKWWLLLSGLGLVSGIFWWFMGEEE